MSGKHLFIITDDAARACLSVFGIGLYGLPEWAEIVDTIDGIEAVPEGGRYLGCWFINSSASRRMQRNAMLRRVAGEIVAAPDEWLARIEAMIAERDAKERALAQGAADAAPAAPAAAEAAVQEDIPQRRASKWH